MHTRRQLLTIATLAPLSKAFAQAAPWPSKPVRVVVGFPPGGGLDIMTRVMAPHLSTSLGQPVYVENKPGAIGTIANEYVARSTPDGHTVLCTVTAAYTTTPRMVKTRYDALRDLPPVTLFARGEQVFVTGKSTQASNLASLLQWVRAHPAKASFGIIGKGTQDHLAGESLRQAANLKWDYIPYNGSGPIVTALMGGDIQIGCMGLSTALPHIQAGSLVPVAIAGTRESPFLPGVGTAGLPQYVSDYVYALALPAGVPAEVIARLNAAVAGALSQPALQEAFRTRALIGMQGSAAEAVATLREETSAIAPLLSSMDLRLE